MAVPSSKEELIRAINSNFSLLNKKLESITPQLAFEPLLEGHAKGTTISVQQLVALIERFSNDELYGKPWYNKWTRGRMIQFNTASPYKNASGRLNKLQKCLAE
ncbi:ClbS/DfsB family four-helix bundle protein [Klebsiella pneumoniae]|nr:ClbS/DfsB family four-helix bundle protein [Klebsiella pneumoniae]